MNTDEFSNAAGCDGTRFSRGFHGTHIAANQDGDVAVEEVLLANEEDVAVFTMASAASTAPMKPRVSTIPNASFT